MTQITKITIDQLTEVTAVLTTDVTLVSRGGVLYKIKPINLQGGLIRVNKTITQSELQSGNTTPIVVQAALGNNTYIVPVVEACGGFLDHNGTTYATAARVRLHHSGQTNYMAQSTDQFIPTTSDRRETFYRDSATVANNTMFSNTALVASLDANATNNGGTLYLSLLLRIISFG